MIIKNMNELSNYIVTYSNFKDFEDDQHKLLLKLNPFCSYFRGDKEWGWLEKLVYVGCVSEFHLWRNGDQVRCIKIGDNILIPESIIDSFPTNTHIFSPLRYRSNCSPYIMAVIFLVLEEMYKVPIDFLHTIISKDSDSSGVRLELSRRVSEVVRASVFHGFFLANPYTMLKTKTVRIRQFKALEFKINFVSYAYGGNQLNYDWALLDSHTGQTRKCSEPLGWRIYMNKSDMLEDRENIKKYWLKIASERIGSINKDISNTERKLESLKNEKKRLSKDIVTIDSIADKILGL